MKAARLGCLLSMLLLASVLWAEEDVFVVQMDSQGMVVEGGGSGYADGEWFFYPYTEWWNQWFYNGPLELEGKKEIRFRATLRGDYAGAAAYAEIAVVWSTDQWPTGMDRPPLPEDMNSPSYENKVIKRQVIFEGEIGQEREFNMLIVVSRYCPAWVSVDVRGINFTLEGQIIHDCIVTEQEQACCFSDGHCDDLTASACLQAGGIPQGAGTDCATTSCPPPTGACCLPDGSCSDLTEARCLAANGSFQGVGTDCNMVDCDCMWTEDQPYKMHWAQMPNPGGWDVEFGASVLADDWLCTESGPVADIHFWISWMKDQQTSIPGFTAMIYSDVPDPDGDGPAYSTPGQLLWSAFFEPGSFVVHDMPSELQGWFDPSVNQYVLEDHQRWQQVDICTIPDPFVQEQGTIYWLALDFGTLPFVGWKESAIDHFNDDGVWWDKADKRWIELRDPLHGESMDLAFVITDGSTTPVKQWDYGDAPDSVSAGGYPTLLINDGARHLMGQMLFLGSWVDSEVDGQPNVTATGDDLNLSDDEDGVTFSTPLVAGSAATIQVDSWNSAYLNAWIDYQANNNWSDPGEHVLVDELLPGGPYTLTFNIPNLAQAGDTYARFRLSTAMGLDYKGPAPDGEVEDYRITIKAESEPNVVDPNIKWSQPPIEIETDHNDMVPTYCGWDEPSYMSPGSNEDWPIWRMVADDFRCLGSMPITKIHWWGSYQNWLENLPPEHQPDRWQITFWSDVVADANVAFSRPGKLLKQFTVDDLRVTEDYVGQDYFVDKPEDSCFKYSLALEPNQVFWQELYLEDSPKRIFWLGISAVYDSNTMPEYVWGWKTRPWHWMDDAVVFTLPQPGVDPNYSDDMNLVIGPNFVADANYIKPIENGSICGTLQSYDVAFELETNPAWVKWQQAFTGLRDWPHYEDEESYSGLAWASSIAYKWIQEPDGNATSLSVDAMRDEPSGIGWNPQVLADDFECTWGGPITGITIWGSWLHGLVPVTGGNELSFTLCIHDDIPAPATTQGYSMPGNILWQKTYDAGQYSVFVEPNQDQGYYSACNGFYCHHDHEALLRYHFGVDPCEAFVQQGTEDNPLVYWLSVQAQWTYPPGISLIRRFGWNTSHQPWNDAAVWAQANAPYTGMWNKLSYPPDHSYTNEMPLNLAFQMTTSDLSFTEMIQHQVADDWRCSTADPVTAAVWWGSYVGHQVRPCDCPVLPEPNKPDYFLLSIWSDVPVSEANDFSHPGELLWQYRARNVDEVMVGFDKHPEELSIVPGREAVYRYSVRFPREKWFWQTTDEAVYWFSVVAVYDRNVDNLKYPWGWTNHPQHFNDHAVTGQYPSGFPWGNSLQWQPLYDQTGVGEDVSFMLFTDPNVWIVVE